MGFVRAEYKIDTNRFHIDKTNIDLIQTLYAKSISAASLYNLTCSICESKYRVEMHHVRKLKDLNPKLRGIDKLMIRKRRKQIAVCRECHMKIHSGNREKPTKTTII